MESSVSTAPRAADAPQREVLRGDLFWVEETSSRGEQVSHPYLIVQDDVFNRSRLPTVVACALSTRLKLGSEAGNVLLDEPSNGLDVMSTRALREFIRGMRDAGRCVVFSSHIMQEVAALCDHIVIVADGVVVAQGSADELRERTGHENLEDAFVGLIGGAPGEWLE